MRILALFLLITINCYSQDKTVVVPTAVAPILEDSTTSFIYCATLELMWNEFRDYLGEMPQTNVPNSEVELLNNAIRTNYSAPIEGQFVVAKAGLTSDSIVDQIRDEHRQKFNQSWYPFYQPSNSAIIAYAYLQKNVRFKYVLDDKFYEQKFNNNTHVDYFGVTLGDPNHKRNDILIHDYIDANDFIIQLASKDSLDEIYLAKTTLGTSLLATYLTTTERVQKGKVEKFTGNDILKIPYILFDTNKRYIAIENSSLTNDRLASKNFISVNQRISFDLNPEGIKLQSMAASIIDFADFEYEHKPRIFSFDDPFLIIMKRKNSELPYFLYWVANTEFMREYKITTRTLNEEELPYAGIWKFSTITTRNRDTEFAGKQILKLMSDGTYSIYRNGTEEHGIWELKDNHIRMDQSEYPNFQKWNYTWEVQEIMSDRLVLSPEDDVKIVLVK